MTEHKTNYGKKLSQILPYEVVHKRNFDRLKNATEWVNSKFEMTQTFVKFLTIKKMNFDEHSK